MKAFLLFCVPPFFLTIASASDPYPRNASLDVKSYTFKLDLYDSTDRISGEATVVVVLRKPLLEFELDLVSLNAQGLGMTVSEVLSGSTRIQFTHAKNRLKLRLPQPTEGEKTFVVRYSGIPEDGLVIGSNKFGDRTFFGDNWPDRGHHWLPCVDHPSDKARVIFIIQAPEQYQVVASGKWKEESNVPKHRKVTVWEESVEIPVKVMTIGVARFSVELAGQLDKAPLTTWVFPQNRDAGFQDFAVATQIVKYFDANIGQYPYEKLAHVQSKTRWGGLENAGNIFYFENSVTGEKKIEGLIAHETAHQWFGNSVTENDWHHVWLSEGFATYFAALYMENTYGRERLAQEMKTDRDQVTKYFVKNPGPVVDTTIMDIGKVLNTNTYQKAGWILHMLRQQIGDDAFWKGIRKYYATYRDRNAMTKDFRDVMESASGMDLKLFFRQWLYLPGHPNLKVTWRHDAKSNELKISVHQNQPQTFAFQLGVQVTLQDGKTQKKSFEVKDRDHTFSMSITGKPAGVILDPETVLLFEATLAAQ